MSLRRTLTILALVSPALVSAVAAREPVRIDLRAGAQISTSIPASPAGDAPPSSPYTPPRDGWVLQQALPNVVTGVSFATPADGYVSAELGAVYRTADGGESWTTVMNVGFPYYWYGVSCLAPDLAVIAGFQNQSGAGVIRWTTDGGMTWTPDIVLDPANWLLGIRFSDFDHGIAYGYQGYVYVTTNGGRTAADWTKIQADPTGGWFAGNFPYWMNGHACLTGISFCRTTDFGMTWTRRGSIDPVFDGGVWFQHDTHGLTGGGQISSPITGWVHRTTDGGTTWSGRVLETAYPIRIVYLMPDLEYGFAAGGTRFGGAGGGIWITTDGGGNWSLDADTGAEMSAIDSRGVSEDSTDVWCVGFLPSLQGVVYKKRVPVPGMAAVEELPRSSPAVRAMPNPFLTGTMVVTGTDGACVLDPSGRIVRRLAGGRGRISWDGRDEAGRPVGPGVYFIRPSGTSGNALRVVRLR